MAQTKTLVLDVVKPDGEVLSTDVDECIIPGAAGSFGVRRGHTPFIAEIGAGERLGQIFVGHHVAHRGLLDVAKAFLTSYAGPALAAARSAPSAPERLCRRGHYGN